MHVEGPSTRDAPKMKKSSICLCSKVESLTRDDVHLSPGKRTSPRSRHSACCLPKQLVLYYHDVELLQLEQERKPARMLCKPTSSCSAPWLSIDSAMCRRKESRLSPSSCRTLQCDQNSDTRQCNRTWIE